MYKKMLFFSLLFCFSLLLSAQDINYFFKILPASYTEDLNASAKDSLLQGKNFYPADNDSLEATVYKLEELDTKRNFLRIGMSFETGQAGYVIFELRSFKTGNGNTFVIFSHVSGTSRSGFFQNSLVVFSYNKTKGLVNTNMLGLISSVSVRNFLRPGTPSSVIKEYDNNSSVNYELGYEGNITLRLYEFIDPENLDKKWLLGDAIEFVWTGDHFIRRKPVFKQ
jgi:hypothetical protein